MSDFFGSSLAPTGLDAGGVAVRVLGNLGPRLTEAVYPMAALTKFHYASHIPGLTGTWMDKGSFMLGGAVRGSYHRLAHGHHLFDDGFKVLVNPKLSFGEFLHHLGMDSLTRRGIPNPFIPKGTGELLMSMGLKKSVVNEYLTLNVPKVLGGSVSLVASGTDVFMAFSDAIPHTWSAAGAHFAFGALNLGFGMFPPNPLLLLSGGLEMGVSAVTAYRTIVDPLIPSLGVPMSVFLPALGQTVALSAILSTCAAFLTGAGWSKTPELVTSAMAGASVGTTVSFMAKAAGMVSPFWGPAAGAATYLLARKLWSLSRIESDAIVYHEIGSDPSTNVFLEPTVIPLFEVPEEPIGSMSGDRFLPNPEGFRRMLESRSAA